MKPRRAILLPAVLEAIRDIDGAEPRISPPSNSRSRFTAQTSQGGYRREGGTELSAATRLLSGICRMKMFEMTGGHENPPPAATDTKAVLAYASLVKANLAARALTPGLRPLEDVDLYGDRR